MIWFVCVYVYMLKFFDELLSECCDIFRYLFGYMWGENVDWLGLLFFG